jgi:chromate reductase
MKFLLLSGSFHSKSRSLAILEAVRGMLDGHGTELPALNRLPFYCEDLAPEPPADVCAFQSQVAEAHGLIFCTPEYNHSLPAVLKNAIDWVSRPAFNSVLKDKPVTIITQAHTPVGGARAQAHLKLVLDSTLSAIHPCHEMMIPDIVSALGPDGRLQDARALARLTRHVGEFVGFVEDKGSL